MKAAMKKSLKPKKSLGQHFLMHARIAARIVHAARLAEDETVLEIGPGTGILTRELLKTAGKVVAVEADRELFEKLQKNFAPEVAEGRLALVPGDIRTFDPASLPREYSLVANIPYYLTGEIFRMFLSARRQPRAMTLLVQKEVAERVARSKKESILSLSIKAYGAPTYEFTVPRGAFRPTPNVDSAVLSIRGISRTNFSSRKEEKRFFELIRAGFAHKRKFARSNLAQLISSRELDTAGIQRTVRPEDMPLPLWLSLSALTVKTRSRRQPSLRWA